jgi:hypothetical protein
LSLPPLPWSPPLLLPGLCPHFAIAITATATKVTAVVVVVIAAVAIVPHLQHVVHAKPPNGQTLSSVAPKGKSTNGILINSVSNFSPFSIAHPYHTNLLPISTIANAIAIATLSWMNSILRSSPCHRKASAGGGMRG